MLIYDTKTKRFVADYKVMNVVLRTFFWQSRSNKCEMEPTVVTPIGVTDAPSSGDLRFRFLNL